MENGAAQWLKEKKVPRKHNESGCRKGSVIDLFKSMRHYISSAQGESDYSSLSSSRFLLFVLMSQRTNSFDLLPLSSWSKLSDALFYHWKLHSVSFHRTCKCKKKNVFRHFERHPFNCMLLFYSIASGLARTLSSRFSPIGCLENVSHAVTSWRNI